MPLPERFKTNVKFSVDIAPMVSNADQALLAQWLHERRLHLQADDTVGQQCWVADADDCPIGHTIRKAVLQHCGEAAKAIEVELPTDTAPSTLAVRLYHHGHKSAWRRDYHADSKYLLSWELTLMPSKRMFVGGEREWLSGELQEPQHLQLTYWDATAMQRVREVECYSARHLHGRYSIFGYMLAASALATEADIPIAANEETDNDCC